MHFPLPFFPMWQHPHEWKQGHISQIFPCAWWFYAEQLGRGISVCWVAEEGRMKTPSGELPVPPSPSHRSLILLLNKTWLHKDSRQGLWDLCKPIKPASTALHDDPGEVVLVRNFDALGQVLHPGSSTWHRGWQGGRKWVVDELCGILSDLSIPFNTYQPYQLFTFRIKQILGQRETHRILWTWLL